MNTENGQTTEPLNLLTEIELKHLNYLSELIDFGVSRIQGVDQNKLGHLQSFLIFNHAVVNNYSEAIYTLCKDARPYAAFVLLRSLFEAHITSEYIKIGDSEKKLALYARDGFRTRNTINNEFDAFAQKYPSKRGSLAVLEEENIKSLREFVEQYISDINSANKLTNTDIYPRDLLDMCRKIDESAVGDDKGEAELMYHLVYRYLSQLSHITPFGLEMFADRDPDGTINLDLGQSKRVHLVIVQTYLYYHSSFQDLVKHQVLEEGLPKKFQDEAEEIKSSKPS